MTAERLPKATHVGDVRIADVEVPCAVLDDGTRVLSHQRLAMVLGGSNPKAHRDDLPGFLSAANLKPWLPAELITATKSPLMYRHPSGGVPRRGYPATIIPLVCEAWMRASRAGVLTAPQEAIAQRAEHMIIALAKTSIIALVDEATGYEKDKQRDELQTILAAYIAPEYLRWTMRFPPQFYVDLYRLFNLGTPGHSKPGIVGHLTNEIVYERLPEGVLAELRRLNPTTEPGRRARKHHQWLSADLGQPHLTAHIQQLMLLMRLAKTWQGFIGQVRDAWPRPNDQLLLFNPDDWKEADPGVKT